MKNTLLLLLSICFIISCSPLEDDVLSVLSHTEYENITVDPNRLDNLSQNRILPRENDCQCTISFSGSPNMQNTTWTHRLHYTLVNGVIGTTNSYGSPLIELPWTIPLNFLL